MTDQEELLTVKEFADRMGVSVNTIRAWIYRRIIPCLKVSDIIRIPLKRAMAALEARTAEELAEHEPA